ncbi:MAG: hypothetical protein L6420_01860, partial [Elusimicrobia bacterium]|nr:hypothetical protein [Elusimicrobiota bacterium]
VRTNLGLAIGTNVQAWDTDLDTLATNNGSNLIGVIVEAANVGTGSLPTDVIASSIAVGAINNQNQIVDGTIVNADLAGSITYGKLNLTGAILNADLAGSITDSKLNQITTAGKVAAGAIADGSLGSGVITSSIAVGAINNQNQIADGTISTGDLADDSVTRAKIDQSGCASGEILKWDGAEWICSLASGAGIESDPLSIHIQDTLQAGATFYVSSGTVAGELRADYFIGDGSNLINVVGDDLGDHTATEDLDMATFDIANVSTITVSTIAISGAGLGIAITSHVFVSGDVHATKFYGDVSDTIGLPSEDNLGNHIATKALDMAAFGIVNVASVSATGPITASSFTATGIEGMGAAQLRLADNVLISSEAGVDLGAGVRISTNVYIVGFSSATKYYGDGSTLTGVVTTAKWIGMSATALNGNRGGYANANAECTAAYSGSHICTNGEIMFSINSGQLGGSFPLNTPLWINNGPPGYTANANDCNGWTSAAATEYGALWNRAGAGDGYGSLQPCNGAVRKFACCK